MVTGPKRLWTIRSRPPTVFCSPVEHQYVYQVE
jgi:hypothetical protein